MGFIDWMFETAGFAKQRRLLALATSIAHDCHLLVWQHVAARSLGMRPAEARGYIRARAVEFLEPRIETALRFERVVLDRPAQERLYEEALEQVVRLVHRQWAHARAGSPLRRLAA